MSSDFLQYIGRIRAACAGFPRKVVSEDVRLRRAAVGIVVVPMESHSDEAGFILTLRSSNLRRHGGQFALPGGRIDQGETPVEAVIRECDEELALKLNADQVIGILDDYPTRSGYVITPVILASQDVQSIVPNPNEVARVYRISVREITREGAAQFANIPESQRPVIGLPLAGTLVHAPTAALLYQFAELLNGRVTRVQTLEQPVFAWR